MILKHIMVYCRKENIEERLGGPEGWSRRARVQTKKRRRKGVQGVSTLKNGGGERERGGKRGVTPATGSAGGLAPARKEKTTDLSPPQLMETMRLAGGENSTERTVPAWVDGALGFRTEGQQKDMTMQSLFKKGRNLRGGKVGGGIRRLGRKPYFLPKEHRGSGPDRRARPSEKGGGVGLPRQPLLVGTVRIV